MAKFNLDNYETVEDRLKKILGRKPLWKNRNRGSAYY